MDKITLLDFMRQAVKAAPDVLPLLTPQTRFLLHTPTAYKSQDYFLRQIEGLVRGVYSGFLRGEFIDIMANLIDGQIYDAYSKAWQDYGEFGSIPPYLESAYQDDVVNQYSFVDQYYRDIIDASLDKTPIEPLLSRARMWANQWTNSYNKANSLIEQENGGNLIWVYGETEHCETCRALNGKVASAKEWAQLGVRPQNAPNPIIQCGGWNCQCQLLPTDKRRTPGVYGKIEEIILVYGKSTA